MSPVAVAAGTDVAGLWVATLQRAIGRASHDVKDALNGVSVNVEVIRSRAARPDVVAAAVAPFAEAAGHQVERLTRLIEAVLALARAERDPADVALALQRIAIVCGASSSNADASVEVHEAREELELGTLTRVPGAVVRLALLAPLLAAVTGEDRAPGLSPVTCLVGGGASSVTVRLHAEGRRLGMPDDVVAAVRSGAEVVTEESQDLSLAFPRA